MEGLDELPDADSDSGGSDSCPSEDNLERPKLREVSERLLRSCSEKPLRKASRVKRKAKKEGATGARQRRGPKASDDRRACQDLNSSGKHLFCFL